MRPRRELRRVDVLARTVASQKIWLELVEEHDRFAVEGDPGVRDRARRVPVLGREAPRRRRGGPLLLVANREHARAVANAITRASILGLMFLW